jgi:hypothetical protein
MNEPILGNHRGLPLQEKIREYIKNNPHKWDEDNDNPENIDINNHSLQLTA